VDDITEHVTHSPVFKASEQSMLFLEGKPFRLVGGAAGKITIFDGHVFWGNRKVSLEALSRSLTFGIEDVLVETGTGASADAAGKAPMITSIIPDIGSAGTGTQVTIHGTGFGENRDSGKVRFFYQKGEPRIEASVILSWSDTEIICAVPTNIINDYAASAGSGPVTVTTQSGTSNGYPFKVTFGFDGQSWWGNNPVVSYYINENTLDTIGEGAAVQAAAETWNETGASIRFNYAGTHKSTTTSRNSKNEILWGTTDAGALAVTYSWWRHSIPNSNGSDVGDRMLECDMVFNDHRVNWSTNPSPFEVDIQSTALHELGHFLSLRDIYGDIGDDEYDTSKIMYGVGENGMLTRSLHPDDVSGIHWIYNPTDPPGTLNSIGYPSESGSGVYLVTWTAGSAASSYHLERSLDGANWVQIYSGPHTYFEEIVYDGGYRYRVAASNIAGSSEWRTGDWTCLVQLSIREGSGEPNDPFLISTAEQLDTMGAHYRWWNKHFRLTADVDLAKYDGRSGRPTFHVMAPDESEPWSGVFDGNGHVISNLTCISSKPGHAGLFGCMADPNAEVKNLTLIGAYVEHLDASVSDRAGGLVGILREGTITACYVDDTNVRGRNRVGGLVGENVNGTIANCSVSAYVAGTDDVGGLVGYNSGYLSTSSSTGTVSGSGWGIGGVAGTNNPQGRITQCYSSGTIRGRERVGGLTGENRQGTVIQCYSIGAVSGSKEEYIGGLVGDNLDGDVEASFWDIITSNRPTSNGGIGKTTADMQTVSTFLDAGWDFVNETANGNDDIWWILEGQDYPRLLWEPITKN